MVNALNDHKMPDGKMALQHLTKMMAPWKPSQVFITYWRFAAKRQRIFINRAAGLPPPWTDDPILLNYRFTNPYRVTDRVTQYLLRHVQYNQDWSIENIFFRTILFKLFNRIETWKHLLNEIGEPNWNHFSISKYNAVLDAQMARGDRVYSAAYIMPSGGCRSPFKRKHAMHLSLLASMMDEGLPRKIVKAKAMEDTFNHLLSYPTIGPFLAYQYATDINYSSITNFDEMDFVVAGPGAKEGISKCFVDTGSRDCELIIRRVCKIQEEAFTSLGISFDWLRGRRLQLIDCQNLFCELAKYARVHHPELNPAGGRSRIKQKFTPQLEPIEYIFPSKWKLNG
jgi:hypothetical protein